MLIEWGVGFLLSLVGGLVDAILPEASPLGIPDLSGLVRGYAWLNGFLPVSEAITATVMIFGVYGLLFGWRLFKTIYHTIPKPLAGT